MCREGLWGSVQKGLYSVDAFLLKKKCINVVREDVAKLPGLAADGAIIRRHTCIHRYVSVCAHIW